DPPSPPLSLHDALPIWGAQSPNGTRPFAGSTYPPESLACSIEVSHRSASILRANVRDLSRPSGCRFRAPPPPLTALLDMRHPERSEEHTSELQSQSNLV